MSSNNVYFNIYIYMITQLSTFKLPYENMKKKSEWMSERLQDLLYS